MFFPCPTGNHPKWHMPEAGSGNAEQVPTFAHCGKTGCSSSSPEELTLTHTASTRRNNSTGIQELPWKYLYKKQRKAPRLQERLFACILMF